MTSSSSPRPQRVKRASSTVTDCWVSIVAEYLDLMGVRYSLDRRRGAFEVFEETDGKRRSLMNIEVLPSGYVVASTIILTVEEIPVENRRQVYEKLLEANWNMPEARYAINESGYLSVALKSTVDSVARENFRNLCQTLVNGTNYFFSDVAPDLHFKEPRSRDKRVVVVDTGS